MQGETEEQREARDEREARGQIEIPVQKWAQPYGQTEERSEARDERQAREYLRLFSPAPFRVWVNVVARVVGVTVGEREGGGRGMIM